MAYDRSAAYQDPEFRERALFARMAAAITEAKLTDARFANIDPSEVLCRRTLGMLPLTRKSDLPHRQESENPLGTNSGNWRRVYVSPGPIFETEQRVAGVWQSAVALDAAGIRSGDLILNTFAYHLVPGGFIVEDGAEILSCPVIAAGPSDAAYQVEIIRRLRPSAYAGTADYLRILTARFPEGEKFPIQRAFISGGAFPQILRQTLKDQGIACFESYATAELGVIAYEIPGYDGLVVNENLIVEILDASGCPVPDGEIGEVVVTKLGPGQPWIRLATGDLSAVLTNPGMSPYTNMRLRGWLGRADQATKVRGMFIRPEQIAQIRKYHPGIGLARFEVSREHDRDQLQLVAEAGSLEASVHLTATVAATVSTVCRLSATVKWVPNGTLDQDTDVIVDLRSPVA